MHRPVLLPVHLLGAALALWGPLVPLVPLVRLVPPGLLAPAVLARLVPLAPLVRPVLLVPAALARLVPPAPLAPLVRPVLPAPAVRVAPDCRRRHIARVSAIRLRPKVISDYCERVRVVAPRLLATGSGRFRAFHRS